MSLGTARFAQAKLRIADALTIRFKDHGREAVMMVVFGMARDVPLDMQGNSGRRGVLLWSLAQGVEEKLTSEEFKSPRHARHLTLNRRWPSV
jgi:hypothetical protein